MHGKLLKGGWEFYRCIGEGGYYPVLVVCMIRVRRLQEIEFDVFPLVGEDSLLKLRACAVMEGGSGHVSTI